MSKINSFIILPELLILAVQKPELTDYTVCSYTIGCHYAIAHLYIITINVWLVFHERVTKSYQQSHSFVTSEIENLKP